MKDMSHLTGTHHQLLVLIGVLMTMVVVNLRDFYRAADPNRCMVVRYQQTKVWVFSEPDIDPEATPPYRQKAAYQPEPELTEYWKCHGEEGMKVRLRVTQTTDKRGLK